MLYIFDWDGTVSNSLNKIVLCVQKAADSLGVEARTVDEIKSIIGLSLPKAIDTLYPSLASIEQESLAQLYSKAFVHDSTPTPLYSGVERTLSELKERGHTLAVATGKTRKGLNRVFTESQVSQHFSSSRCADETASKPNPLMLFELMEELGFRAEESVMIGDTTFDLEMAKNAGMKRIGVNFGSHSESELSRFQPELILESFDGLLDWEF
ncbi:HAD-IIIA family hydrolase [Sessilibacter corallicola]|uniref:HAD-IA family hydrolase n=1 Tax=Sessilibacter corallicola TaxID=2904075 RepID=A0ABQ0A9G4_9GAMM|nr:HAD-IIIA family hydrolase [Sessilibacter corallicola]